MTYLQFLGIFMLPPVALLLLVARGRVPWGLLRWQVPLLLALAVLYTAPWDRQLIVDGVWSYAGAQVVGRTVLSIPVEEYGFYALQTLLVGLVAGLLWRRLGEPGP